MLHLMRAAPSCFLLLGVVAIAAPPGRASPATVDVHAGDGDQAELVATGARARSQAALQVVLATSPAAHALWRPGQAGPSVLTGLQEPTRGSDVAARARSFVAQQQDLIGVPSDALQVVDARTMHGRTVVELQQTWRGREVLGRKLVLTLDDAGRVLQWSNDTQAIEEVARARVALAQAKTTALAAARAAGGSDGREVIVADARGAFEAALFFVSRPATLEAFEVVVNLSDGSVASTRNAVRQ